MNSKIVFLNFGKKNRLTMKNKRKNIGMINKKGLTAINNLILKSNRRKIIQNNIKNKHLIYLLNQRTTISKNKKNSSKI